MAASALVLSTTAIAQSQTRVQGTIWRVDVISGAGGAPGNYDARVYLNGVSSFCPGATDATWAYLNSSDQNYKSILAAMMFAYGAWKTLVVYAEPITSGSATFCRIDWINIVG